MWKKRELDVDKPTASPPGPTSARSSSPGPSNPGSPAPPPLTPSRGAEARRGTATIGPSISIFGNLSGQEDLLIDGAIEGEVSVKEHRVTVGPHGRLKADVRARSIRVEGEVHGNLYGAEEVILCAAGKVRGNIQAPRVTLEDGSLFQGSIDMNPTVETGKSPDAGRTDTGRKGPGQPLAATKNVPQEADEPRKT